MDMYISAQLELLEQIKRTHINFKKLPKDRQNVNYINTKLQLLEQTWNSIQENHLKLLRSYDKKTLATTDYVHNNVYFNCEEEYTAAKVTMLEKLQNFTQPDNSTAVTNNNSLSSTSKPVEVKIPVIKIPTFNGSYTEWYSFHDQFVSLIHNNDTLKNVQKLHYLKMHVIDEAANLLRNISVIDNNYEHAWEKLKKRYSNKRVIVNAYLHKLMSIRNINIESANSIKHLLDTTTDCLSGLNSTGVDTKNWDAIIVYLTVNKLDTESLKHWEDKINRDNDDDTIPTFDMLVGFLEARFRALEGIQSTRTNNLRTRQNTHTIEKRVHYTENRKQKCTYCDGDHYLNKCRQFASLSYEDKKNFVERKQLCFNCLVPYHGVKLCKHTARCHSCGKKHHSLIHPPPRNIDQINNIREETSNIEQNIQSTNYEDVVTHFAKKNITNILLATAMVKVRAENGRVIQLRALIDQGSEGSFITETATQTLGLRRKRTNGYISGVGDKSLQTKHMITFILESNTNKDFAICVEAYVLKTLTKLLPSKQVHVTWPHIQGLPLADSSYGTPGKIDLLLGAAVYSRILQKGVINGPTGTPLAQNTLLGWILSGEVNATEEQTTNTIVSMHVTTVEESKLLQKFWEVESIDSCKTKRTMTEEELECENIYKSTHKRDSDGRYIVEIPIKDKTIDYGESKSIARRRLDQLERKLNRDKDLKEEYTKVLMEYKDLGHMEEIVDDINEQKMSTREIFYLPHHAVVRRDKTTSKVRIVFNASSKASNGVSLNDNMLVGPTIQRDLRHIVMTWRKHKIAFVADCVKMYRQIKVTDECANLQRILWRVNGKVQEYKLTRVTFGTSSAPYLATKTIQQLAKDEKEKYPIASQIAMTDFYMDDLLSGGDNVEQVKNIYTQIINMMKAGGFEMQKWASNSTDFINYVEKTKRTKDETYSINNDEIVKTLGIRWQRRTDTFQYIINLDNDQSNKSTKRTILAMVARLFDPMGWLAPIIVIAKTFIQKLWLAGIDWDQEIPMTLKEEWLKYKENLTNINDISLNRWLSTNEDDPEMELHGYSDASSIAYAAVVYLKVVKRNGSIHTHLITAKTKVAPIKTISVPRLELCGAVLLANLIKEVATHLNVSIDKTYAYTDSKVVLAWLQSHPSRWKTFVANRTSEILELLPSHHWYHVTSENNPADVASRGTTASQLLKNTLWWSGPKELKEKEFKHRQLKENTTKLEEKTIKVMTITREDDYTDLFLKYSKLIKLLRVMAYILRFFKKDKPKHKHLTGEDIEKAMMRCVLIIQSEEYSKEIQALKDKKPISTSSKLRTLNPFLDENGVVRVGGRLAHANIPDDAKHQIILPSKHPFTKLILLDCHEKTLHGGPMLMLSYLRTKFWVTNAKSSLREIPLKCVRCARYRASTATQMMGSLPKARVTPAKPFLNSGVDLAGPIDLRLSKGRGCKTQKGYIVIFICLVTRAIHIEIVSGLTAQAFVAAFKRFVARRGQCKDIWSDNATNLTAGNKELMSAFERSIENVRTEIEELLANEGTTWHHIPACAPHFGGLWEAGVKSIKFHLRRILRNTTLTYEEMATVMTQIEATLNSRPISPMSDDPFDIRPLTPGHFLIGEAPLTVPDRNYLDTNINRLDRWQLTQRMFQDFWQRWSREYLFRLQQRPKWTKIKPNVEVGQLVLLKEDNIPPGKWLMARVIETHPGKDNLNRVVTVKCKNSILKRPITKVCCLPVEN